MQTIQASQFEDLFEEKLHLYDSDKQMVEQEQHDQDQVAAQVREANRAFTNAQHGDASSKAREKALQELENGYLKYKEILSNIEVGRKFYNDLAKHVGRFRDDCKSFVQQRRMEASQIEAYVLPLGHLLIYTDWVVKSRASRQWHRLTSLNRISASSQQAIRLRIASPSLSLPSSPKHNLNLNSNPNHSQNQWCNRKLQRHRRRSLSRNRCKCNQCNPNHDHQLPGNHCKHHNRHAHRCPFPRRGYGLLRWGYDSEDRQQEGDKVSRGRGILTRGYDFLNKPVYIA